jgi:hypothetical protein
MFVSMHTKSITTKQIHNINMNPICNTNATYDKTMTTVSTRSLSVMKKRLTALFFIWSALATLTLKAANDNQIKATHNAIQYIGRVEHNSTAGTVRYDWVGTHLRTGFMGTQISVLISDEGESYHNVFIDGKWVKKIKVKGNTPQRIVLATGLKAVQHQLELQKCTEGEYGCTTVHAFILPKGASLHAVDAPKRLIEVIGDSYTCGYGSEGSKATEPFKLETENCNKAYACLLARYFDADYVLTAHSGRGMVRNWGDSVQISKGNMSHRYLQLFDHHGTTPYDFKAYRPNLVLINLGTNDYSPIITPTVEQYVGAYVRLIELVRKNYGPVPVICIRPHSAGAYLSASFKVLQQRMASHKDVHFAEFMPGIITVEKDLGSNYHPNLSGQQKICMTLAPLVSAVMGWDIVK